MLNDYVDEHGYLDLAKAILKSVGNLRLVGETGTGKTRLVYELAKVLNCSLYEIVLSQDTTRWDLLTCDTLVNGTTVQRDGLVLQWLKDTNKNGSICYIDGFNYAISSILSFLESISDFRGNVNVPELCKTFVRTEKHYLVISYNPAEKSGYSGTHMCNIATLRRFEGLEIQYLSAIKEIDIIKGISNNYQFSEKFVELANKTREAYKTGKLRMPITTGNLINYAKMFLNGMCDDDLITVISSMYGEEEKETFNKFIEKNGELEKLVSRRDA